MAVCAPAASTRQERRKIRKRTAMILIMVGEEGLICNFEHSLGLAVREAAGMEAIFVKFGLLLGRSGGLLTTNVRLRIGFGGGKRGRWACLMWRLGA